MNDRLGSVRNIANSTGILIDTITYEGFGNVTNETNSAVGDPWKFTRRELDSETGLQFNRAPYLDQKDGRWTTRDPLGFDAGDANLYRYIRNDPTNATDPLGLLNLVAKRLRIHGDIKDLDKESSFGTPYTYLAHSIFDFLRNFPPYLALNIHFNVPPTAVAPYFKENDVFANAPILAGTFLALQRIVIFEWDLRCPDPDLLVHIHETKTVQDYFQGFGLVAPPPQVTDETAGIGSRFVYEFPLKIANFFGANYRVAHIDGPGRVFQLKSALGRPAPLWSSLKLDEAADIKGLNNSKIELHLEMYWEKNEELIYINGALVDELDI